MGCGDVWQVSIDFYSGMDYSCRLFSSSLWEDMPGASLRARTECVPSSPGAVWQVSKDLYDNMDYFSKLGRLSLPWSMFAYPFYLVSLRAGA